MVEDRKSAQPTFATKVELLVNIYANLKNQSDKLRSQNGDTKNGSHDVYNQIIDLAAETITQASSIERPGLLITTLAIMDRRDLFNISFPKLDFVQKILFTAIEKAKSRSLQSSQK